MKILVIGSGGREHAIAWKIAQSPQCEIVYVAPGNGGTATENKVKNINITEIPKLLDFAIINNISFTIVGPELPLSLGIVDIFRLHNLKIWGPTKFCAQLESSKAFAKEFMVNNNIPTAKYITFDNKIKAKDYLNKQNFPIVIKADGLASGKGVLVATNLNEALNFIDDIFTNNTFGKGQSKVVIEEFLEGIEASFIVMIDGKNILAMASSQDHKRLLNQNKGPNTGGMGAYSPAPIITNFIHNRVINEIITPVIEGMKKLGHEYSGFLYAGLMIDKQQNIKTLEFNCRLGDPEAQPILMRLESDFIDIINYGLNKNLDKVIAKWYNSYSVGVILASYGYPQIPRKDDIISNLPNITDKNVKIFHSGTTIKNKNLYTSGGRVMCVVAHDPDIKQAKAKVYHIINKINFTGMQYRSDISDYAFIKME